MERVQLTDEEIEALSYRMEKEGHHLTAGTMRQVETIIQARLGVENEVRDMQENSVITRSNLDNFIDWYNNLVPSWWVFGPISSALIVANVFIWLFVLGMRLAS
jgi:hypothetical protein